MSTPGNAATKHAKPTTRSANKRTAEAQKSTSLGASPTLNPRKRKSSSCETLEEPLPKRMADNQILEAINGIKNTMATKADMGSMLNEIRSVKENVIRNKDRIDTLRHEKSGR